MKTYQDQGNLFQSTSEKLDIFLALLDISRMSLNTTPLDPTTVDVPLNWSLGGAGSVSHVCCLLLDLK